MAQKVAMRRCGWCLPSGKKELNPLMVKYHDEEWGVQVHDDRVLFEFLVLEGAQAGLNWQTILNKRKTYRKAFANFDVKKVARFGAPDVRRLLADPGIIRNRLKVAAAIANAKAFLLVQKEFGSFDRYLWRFVNSKPINHKIKNKSAIPVTTKESDALSKDLRMRGFRFVGSTICYAFMQAVGMVNDHEVTCFRLRGISTASR